MKNSFLARLPATALARTIIVIVMAAISAVLLATPRLSLQEVAALQKTQIEEYAAAGLWYAGLASLLPLLALAISAPLWTRALPPRPAIPARGPLPRGFWPLVFGAMILFAGLAAPRLSQSLWDDEEYAVRKTILGTYRADKNGLLVLKETRWTSTLWYYQSPNNHCFQTILSRLSHSAYRAAFRPSGLQINETAVRLPSYAAGILAVGALAFFVARMGCPWAGVLAAWLLAVHPWFLRIAPEARGYAFIFLLLPCIFLLAQWVIEQGTWRAIASLTATEFLILYTWPGILLTLLALNAALVVLVFKNFNRRDTATVLARWAAAGLLAGSLLLVLVAPWIPQFMRYVKNPLMLDFSISWLKNLGALMLTGSHWSESGLDVSPYLELYPRVSAHPLPFIFLAGGAAILIGAGCIRWLRSGPFAAALVPILLLPGPIIYALAKIKHGYLFDWYLSFMLPGLIALAAVGCVTLTAILVRPPLPRWIAPAAACCLALLFFSSTQFARACYMSRPVEHYRESVLATRPTLNPNAPENQKIITATSGSLTPIVYDPLVRTGKTLEDYLSWMREADASGSSFFVNLGHPFGVTEDYPKIRALLADERYFACVAVLRGAKPLFDRIIYKYRAGSLPARSLIDARAGQE